MPLVHRNTLKFIGMESKQDYRVWREQDGKFTALHKSGYIRTRSLATGKVMFSKDLVKKCRNGKVMELTVPTIEKHSSIKFKCEKCDYVKTLGKGYLECSCDYV